MLTIASNVQSLMITNNLNNITKNISDTTTRISTGKRINSASDDPAGLQISTRMKTSIQGYGMAKQNISQGQAILNVMDAGLQGGVEILQSMRQLALESKNDTLSNEQRNSIQESFSALQKQYDQTISGSELFGKNLLENGAEDINIQSGIEAGQYSILSAVDSSSLTLGIDSGSIDISSISNSDLTIENLDTALETLSRNQAVVGAQYNGLESRMNVIDDISENTTDALSRVEDADMANETSKLQLLRVQQQMAMQALSFVNQAPSNILSLLR
jgi:flagellin